MHRSSFDPLSAGRVLDHWAHTDTLHSTVSKQTRCLTSTETIRLIRAGGEGREEYQTGKATCQPTSGDMKPYISIITIHDYKPSMSSCLAVQSLIHARTPGTGLRQSSSHYCHNGFRHRSSKSVSEDVSAQMAVHLCNRQLELYQPATFLASAQIKSNLFDWLSIALRPPKQ